MSFGSCCIFDDEVHAYLLMKAKSVEVKGEEFGLLVNFELTQTFYHDQSSAKEACYYFSNDLKMCIYDTTFVIGEEIIKPKLQSKDEAKITYEEAVEKGHTAVCGFNYNNGLTQFKLGNVPPLTDCKVIIKAAFTANMTKNNSFFIKFPLDSCMPDGSKRCRSVIYSNFQFQLQCDKEIINNVTSNIENSHYDDSTKLFTIKDQVQNANEHSIIIRFETKENIQSSVLIGDTTNDYNNCAITISPNLENKPTEKTMEFIFVVDCSASMKDKSIQKAAECLDLFIRSLPENSYFNIIRFGSIYEKLFTSSVEYNESNIEKALNLASNLEANLHNTDIYRPLLDVCREPNKFGQRQVFIMTDGKVGNASRVINLVSHFSNENRCFTIGIGSGCDKGLVEGIANSSGGKCDFVQEGDSISEKVIPQLETSLFANLSSIEINIEGQENDSFQISPYPLPILPSKGCRVVYLCSKKKDEKNQFENNFLITADYGGETVEIPIEVNSKIEGKEEDKYGRSDGHNIGKAILPLFAFNLLKKYEKKNNISEDERKKAIELSISSGVLCKFTGYVGIYEKRKKKFISDDDDFDDDLEKRGYNNRRRYMRSVSRSCNRGANNRGRYMRSVSRSRDMGADNNEICIKRASRSRGGRANHRGRYMHQERESPSGRATPNEVNIGQERESPSGRATPNEVNIGQEGERPRVIVRIGCKFDWGGFCNLDTVPKRYCPEIQQPFNEMMRKTEKIDANRKIMQNDLMDLLHLQDFHGYWEDLEKINHIIGSNVSSIDGVDVTPTELAEKCIATILAVAALHVKWNNQKNLWIMIEQKAIKWLKKSMPEANIDQLIKNTESSIND